MSMSAFGAAGVAAAPAHKCGWREQLAGSALFRIEHVLGEEPLGRFVEAQPVLGLGEPVALVGKEHVLVIDTVLGERSDDLLRLRLIDTRVVRALRDQQRYTDLIDARERRALP